MPNKFDNYVKKPGQQLEYTPELIQELEKCKNDFFYFCKYIQVKHPDLGRIKFEPRGYQKEFLNKILNNRYFVGLMSRQVGKTLSVSVYILGYALFNSEKTVGIVSNKQSSATKILSEIKKMYEFLPSFLKSGVKIYNMTSIEFENNTTILVSATTEDPFRSYTLNLIFADELSFIKSSIAEAFWSSNFPTLAASEESQVIVISTPCGQHNLFHRLFSGAENNKNGFACYKADGRVIEGRDEQGKQEQIDILGKVQFEQEHGISFLGSTNTVIDPDTLEVLLNKTIDPVKYEMSNKFRIGENPQEEYQYVAGIDVAKGTGEHDSAIQVLKITAYNPFKVEQIAVFQDNFTDVYNFSSIVHRVAIYYNNAFIVCENNAEGSTVVNELGGGFEYENLVNESDKSTGLGIRATTKTKPKAVLAMKKLIEEGSLILNDRDTANELTSFIDFGNSKFAGKDLPDDLVAALYGSCYITEFEVLNKDTKVGSKIDDEGWGFLDGRDYEVEDSFEWLDNINI